MAIAQERLLQFREVIGSRPETERKRFIKRFKELSSEKKEMAINRVLAQSPEERTRVRESNIIAQEGVSLGATGIGEESPGEKLGRAAPAFGQFVGGVAGGMAGAALLKTPQGAGVGARIGAVGGRILAAGAGGVAGRALGLTGRSLSQEEGLFGETEEQRKRFLGDIKTTAGTEAIFGIVAGGVGGLLKRAGVQIEGSLLGKRVSERLSKKGLKTIFNPKFFKGRIPKEIVLKTGRFVEKLNSTLGGAVKREVNKKEIRGIKIDYSSK